MTTETSSPPSDSKEAIKGYREGESFQTGAQAKRERQAAYAEWLVTPEDQREPKTKTEFAKLWDVTTQTLRNDEREPFVQRTISERARAGFRAMNLPRVIESLTKIAVGESYVMAKGELVPVSNSASVSAAKTLLDWAEKTSAVREDKIDLKGLTEQELIEFAMRVLNEASRGVSD